VAAGEKKNKYGERQDMEGDKKKTDERDERK
jgi:hypothetical protein